MARARQAAYARQLVEIQTPQFKTGADGQQIPDVRAGAAIIYNPENGQVLWETALGGPIQNSTITYSVNGKQYVAVFTGIGLNTVGIIDQAAIKPNRTFNALYIFALP